MTRDEILAMKPGPELDALVAEKVMGWEYKDAIYSWGEVLRPSQWIKPNGWPVDRVSCYSTDISAAFEVWEHDRPEDWIFDLSYLKGHYYAEIFKPYVGVLAKVRAKSAPEAICKAALLAVMEG